MVTDQQVRRLRMLIHTEKTKVAVAAKVPSFSSPSFNMGSNSLQKSSTSQNRLILRYHLPTPQTCFG